MFTEVKLNFNSKLQDKNKYLLHLYRGRPRAPLWQKLHSATTWVHSQGKATERRNKITFVNQADVRLWWHKATSSFMALYVHGNYGLLGTGEEQGKSGIGNESPGPPPCSHSSRTLHMKPVASLCCTLSCFGLAVRCWAGKQMDVGLCMLQLSFLFKSCGLRTLSSDCPSQWLEL